LYPAWETFYVIVGTSAGALTGLMFVVIAMVMDFGGSEGQLEAFGTPTVVHFSGALMLSVLVTAPWPGMLASRFALGAFGAAGMVYMFIVLSRTRAQTDYKPVFEDWLFHAALPLVAYVSVFAAAVGLARGTTLCLFVVGASAVLLLFIGIHNAWDTTTYIVIARWERRRGHAAEAQDADRTSDRTDAVPRSRK
jgi:hypothetical protein